jgi:hypothetical protein
LFGSFLPSLLVGFSTTNFTRASEPTLSWNQFHSHSLNPRRTDSSAAPGIQESGLVAKGQCIMMKKAGL